MSLRSRRYFRIFAGLTVVSGLAACVIDPLNPQPLPPGPDPNAILYPDASFSNTSDSGALGTGSLDGGDRADDGGLPPNAPDDAGATDDAAADAGDAGDADAGDADADAK